MKNRRNSGRIGTKTTKSSGLGKNQTAPCASPKKKKSPKNKNKPASKLVENIENAVNDENKLVLNSEKNSIDMSKIPVSEVSECQLASFTTTETESVATELTESTIDKFNKIPSEVSEVILQPVAQIRPEPISQEEKYTNNTILIDDDMLAMTVGALGDKYRTYIPNLRAHKVTVNQLMLAEFDTNDYLKMGIHENDVPKFMSHFNGGHELSLNATTDFQSANDVTPEKIEEFTTEFDFRTEKEEVIFDEKNEIEVEEVVSEDVVEKITVQELSESVVKSVQESVKEAVQESVEETINASVETEFYPVSEEVEATKSTEIIESVEPVNTHVIFSSDEDSVEDSDVTPTSDAFQIHKSAIKKPVTREPIAQETTTQKPATEEPTTEEPTTQEPTTQEPTAQEPTTKEQCWASDNFCGWLLI
jgi:hypothetical protein